MPGWLPGLWKNLVQVRRPEAYTHQLLSDATSGTCVVFVLNCARQKEGLILWFHSYFPGRKVFCCQFFLCYKQRLVLCPLFYLHPFPRGRALTTCSVVKPLPALWPSRASLPAPATLVLGLVLRLSSSLPSQQLRIYCSLCLEHSPELPCHIQDTA